MVYGVCLFKRPPAIFALFWCTKEVGRARGQNVADELPPFLLQAVVTTMPLSNCCSISIDQKESGGFVPGARFGGFGGFGGSFGCACISFLFYRRAARMESAQANAIFKNLHPGTRLYILSLNNS